MSRLVFFTIVLSGLLLFIVGSSDSSVAQTAIGNPSGTSVSYSPSGAVNIGKGSGRTRTYTNGSWPSSCVGWGVSHTLTGIVNGANTGGCSGLTNLSYNSGQSNLNNGVAVFTGNTNYRYYNTSNNWVTQSVPVRLTLTTRTTGNAVMPLCNRNSKLYIAVTGNFKVTLFIEANGPTNGNYSSGGSGWDGAVDVYDRLYTPSSGYSICTSFNDGTFYQLSGNTANPTNVSPANGSQVFASSVTLDWSGTLGTGCPTRWEYQVNGGGWTSTGTTSSVNSGTLNWGANTWRIRKYDGCSNSYHYGPTWTVYRVANSSCGTTIDHGGNNWTISSNTTVSGYHTNIGNFTVNASRTATVATGCEFSVKANNITISGTINGNSKGDAGGSGGSAGGTYGSCGNEGNNAYSGGRGYRGNAGSGAGGGNVASHGTNATGRSKKMRWLLL